MPNLVYLTALQIQWPSSRGRSEKYFKVRGFAGIQYVDTAQSYGTSESVLGRCMSRLDFQVISKLPSQDDMYFTVSSISLWEKFFSSLKAMGLDTLDSFLLHSTADLEKLIKIFNIMVT